LLSAAGEGPLGELDRAMLQRLNGQIALDLRRGGDAVPLLLGAARALEPLDAELARETYLEALRGRERRGPPRQRDARRGGGGASRVGRTWGAARDRRAAQRSRYPVHRWLRRERRAPHTRAGGPSATMAVEEGNVRWPWLARRVAPDLFDDDAWHALATRNVEIARESGALAVLPLALNLLSLARCFEGELRVADSLIDEADGIAEATGTTPILFGRILLSGCRGDERAALPLIEAGEATAIARGEGVVLTFGEHARALLHNASGQHEAALAPARAQATATS